MTFLVQLNTLSPQMNDSIRCCINKEKSTRFLMISSDGLEVNAKAIFFLRFIKCRNNNDTFETAMASRGVTAGYWYFEGTKKIYNALMSLIVTVLTAGVIQIGVVSARSNLQPEVIHYL